MNDEPRPSSEMNRGHHQNCAPRFKTAHIGFPPIRSAVRWRLATLAGNTNRQRHRANKLPDCNITFQ